MVERLWPGEDPLEKRFNTGGMDPYREEWLTVVEVVGEVRDWSEGRGENATYYVDHRQRHTFLVAFGGILVVRGRDSVAVGSLLRNVVRRVDSAIPVRVRTLESRIGASASDRRFTAFVLGAFGMMGLLRAAVGVYGVVAHSVARRTPEIGIRVVLGTAPTRVRRRVVAEAAGTAMTRLAAGFGVAPALAGTMSGVFHRVDPAATLRAE